uniref:Protein kinase domain-containing protein n=1 Tax=Alexandrium monilatum TaxID=311494 RepID=A0A7S4QAN0_9DINO
MAQEEFWPRGAGAYAQFGHRPADCRTGGVGPAPCPGRQAGRLGCCPRPRPMQLMEYLGATLETITQSGGCGSCVRSCTRSTGQDTGRDLQEVAVEYSWAEVASATGGFAQDRRIGRGASGIVYRGALQEGTDVAVKVIRAPVGAGFQDEVRLLSRCRHPNVVMLLGFAREETSIGLPARTGHSSTVRQRALVYELLPGGDAHVRLHASKSPFPWRERLQTAIGVSRGLAHLHRHRPEIFHRDIKTQNVLFGADGTAKIADFGLACVQAFQGARGLAVDEVVGTLGYADPLDEETGVVTEANEVYSFGMVLVELLTSCLPAKMAPDGDGCLFLRDELKPDEEGSKHRVLQRLDARAQWPLLTATSLATFALLCIHGDVDRRPTFVEAATLLQEVVHEAPEERKGSAAATESSWNAPVTCDGRPPQTHGKAMAASRARRAAVVKAPVRTATVQRFASAAVTPSGRPAVQVLCAPAAAPPKSAASVAAAAAPGAKGAPKAGAPPPPAQQWSRPKTAPMRSASSPQLDVRPLACRPREHLLVMPAVSAGVRA